MKEWPVDIRGGGETDWLGAPWPFARLRADKKLIDYKLMLANHTVEKKDVTKISVYTNKNYQTGIRVTHSLYRRNDLPVLLAFYTEDNIGLMKQLRELGYTVE